MSKFKRGDKVLVFGGREASDNIRTVYTRLAVMSGLYSLKEVHYYVYDSHMTRAILYNPINRLLYPEYKPYKQFLVEELPNEKENK
jgi:hypothetical protein